MRSHRKSASIPASGEQYEGRRGKKKRRLVDIATFSSSSLEGATLEGRVTRVWPLRPAGEATPSDRYLNSTKKIFNLEVEDTQPETINRPKASIEIFFYDRWAERCSRARKGDIIRLTGSGVVSIANPVIFSSADHEYRLIVAEHNSRRSDNNVKIEIVPYRNESELWAIPKEKTTENFGPPLKLNPRNLHEYDSWIDEKPNRNLTRQYDMDRICEELDINAEEMSRKDSLEQGPFLALRAANKEKRQPRRQTNATSSEKPNDKKLVNQSKKYDPPKKRRMFTADIAQLIKEKRRRNTADSLGNLEMPPSPRKETKNVPMTCSSTRNTTSSQESYPSIEQNSMNVLMHMTDLDNLSYDERSAHASPSQKPANTQAEDQLDKGVSAFLRTEEVSQTVDHMRSTYTKVSTPSSGSNTDNQKEGDFWPTQSSGGSSFPHSQKKSQESNESKPVGNQSQFKSPQLAPAVAPTTAPTPEKSTTGKSKSSGPETNVTTGGSRTTPIQSLVTQVHPPHAQASSSDYTPLRNLVLNKKAHIMAVIIDRAFPRSARKGTDFSGQMLVCDDSTSTSFHVQIFSKSLSLFPKHANFGDVIIIRNAKIQQFHGQPQILCNKRETKFAILGRDNSISVVDSADPASISLTEEDKNKADSLMKWFECKLPERSFFSAGYVRNLEEGFLADKLFMDTIACVCQQPKHLTLENGEVDENCVRFTVWDGSNLNYKHPPDAYPPQAAPLCRGCIIPVIASCHVDILEHLNLQFGDWVRLRNVKFHFKPDEPDDENSSSDASTSKAIYVQENSGAIVLPEKCQDVQDVLSKFKDRASELDLEDAAPPSGVRPQELTKIHDTYLEEYNQVKELAHPGRIEFEKFKVKASVVAYHPLDVRDFCVQSDSGEYEYRFQLRFVDPWVRSISVGYASFIDVLVQGSDGEQFFNIPPTNLHENQASADAIARRLEQLFKVPAFDACVALVPRTCPEDNFEWMYLLADTSICSTGSS
eukprot:gb/GECG01007108.1/.p1 GENE.gb/GECG01007108.1/~~gb/GECG01007108.1/.p1  ORF type:complete len:990 (+),score=129.82 gb/GECG01007108.1/:1-2970(+)